MTYFSFYGRYGYGILIDKQSYLLQLALQLTTKKCSFLCNTPSLANTFRITPLNNLSALFALGALYHPRTTHFIRRLNMREQLIREVETIPLEVVVRNVAAGSLSQRLGIEEGTQLPRSIIEFYYKNDQLNDPMVSEEHITAFGWATPQEIDDIMSLAIRVNDFLSGLFLGVGIRLVDFKMETGRLWENDLMRIVVADEISPDSCRLWDIKSNEKLDKDRFRRDLGGLVEAYTEVAKRLGIMSEGERPQGAGPVLVKS